MLIMCDEFDLKNIDKRKFSLSYMTLHSSYSVNYIKLNLLYMIFNKYILNCILNI